jgi:prephenate dehydrogenase
LKTNAAIVGLGLMGGSLGQALRRSGRYRVIGIARRAATLRDAKRLGAIDEGSIHFQEAAKASIVVLATPVASIVPTLRRLLPFLKPGTIVTDVGSVKGSILRDIAKLRLPKNVHFIGSHPLAGSHRKGVAAAQRDLFKGATCVVIPFGKAPRAPVLALWKAAGARTLLLNAERHDRAVAVTSHLPHVLAHALVHTVMSDKDRLLLKNLAAGSFRDMTRVASSDPDYWADIFQANLPAVRLALRQFRRELNRLESSLSRPALRLLLKKSYAFRQPLFASAS